MIITKFNNSPKVRKNRFNEYIDDNTIAVYVGRLREKLAKENVSYIKTVWGVGYKWEM